MAQRTRPRFNEKKATQAAARFLLLSGRKLPYIRLLKLMYFMDREALIRWGEPVTNDRYFSLDRGPILSAVKNLIYDEPEAPTFWNAHISSPSNYMIELIDEPGNEELSAAEEHLIEEIHNQYGHLDRWQLVKKSHELPEWDDPHGSSNPIEIDDILKAAGKKRKERDAIKQTIEHHRTFTALFCK
jgi:uncharacterized phage-associated protein